MAGAAKDTAPSAKPVPNITPDKETGIGDWKREDIAELLLNGIKPDFDNVQGLMYEVIQGTPHGYKDMTKGRRLAIADYLKSIPRDQEQDQIIDASVDQSLRFYA